MIDRWRKRLHWFYAVLCMVHCGSTALHNIYALFPVALAPLRELLASSPLQRYRHYTGGDSSYGFFGPQVANMFILQLQRDTAGDTIRWIGPGLSSGAGKTRYQTLMNLCQYLSQHNPAADSVKRRRVENFLHRLARHELPPTPTDPTRCTIYAVRHVPLGTPRNMGKPRLEILYDAFIGSQTMHP